MFSPKTLRGSLAHKAASIFIITVMTGSSLATIIPSVAHAITVLPLENFGTVTVNDIPNWDEEGTDSDSSTLAQAAGSGNDSASPDSGAFAKIAQGEWICREINAANREGLKLSYYWRGDSDAGSSSDDGIVEYKAGSGSCSDASGWNQLQNHDMRDDASWTTQNAFNLPNGLDNTTFRLRFKSNTNSSDEYFRVDGITITDSSNYAVTVDTPVSISGLTLSLTGTGEGTPYVGQLSAHDVQVNWGNGVVDNTSTKNFTDPAGGPKNFTGTWGNSITYAAAGIYTIVVKLYHQTPPGAESSGDSVYSFQVTIPEPDACPEVPGTQASGPCANDTCVQGDGLWNGSSCVADACPNVVGHQATGPCADETCTQSGGVWNGSSCTPDACENVTGHQPSAPCADTECPAESTWSIDLQECVENPPTDEEICLENGDQWIEGECYTDAEACELQEGMSWNGDECVTDEVPPTDEEVCLEGGGNWVNNECLTDEELCVAQDGMAWVDGECLSHDIICDTFEMLNIPQPDYCDDNTEENEPVDTDNDGIVDEEDNCPTVANADQADANENSIGDACEDTNNDSEETNEQETPSGGGSSGGGRIEKACDNNVDDDGDGLYDMNDPGCTSTTDNSEENPGEVLGASTANTCSALLTTYMRINRENDVEEVKKLQTFLNGELGLTLEVNGIFDQATHDAVNAFQLKYESEVLTPWGPFGLPAGTPTGYVYKTTQRWINMKHCASLNLPMPELN